MIPEMQPGLPQAEGGAAAAPAPVIIIDDDLQRTEAPDANWFYDAQSHPKKNLLLFLYNSGHAYFPYIKNNVLPHSSECPAIMKDSWDDDDDVPYDVRQLHTKLLDVAVTDETVQARVKAFADRVRLDGCLPSCGSCGIRDEFIAEEDLLPIGVKRMPRRTRADTGPTEAETMEICSNCR